MKKQKIGIEWECMCGNKGTTEIGYWIRCAKCDSRPIRLLNLKERADKK